jgi:hypothetical protein
VSVAAADEAPREDRGAPAGFSEAITFAFGDPQQSLFGVARIGLSGSPDAARTASGLALLFAEGEPVAVRADGGVPIDASPAWEDVAAAGLRTTVDEPLRAWSVTFADEDGTSGFTLSFVARSQPAELAADAPAARAGGMTGYEQLCHVHGTVRVRGREARVDCLGQRGRSWGAPDWDKIGVARTVSGWLGDDLGFTVTAIRSARATNHADDALAAFLLSRVAPEPDAPGSAAAGDDATGDRGAAPPADDLVDAVAVEDPRLSTTYDEEDRQRSAGLELYVRADDDTPHRAAGEVLCGTSMDLGRLHLDTAFFAWRMEGRTGIGRYDVLRRAA